MNTQQNTILNVNKVLLIGTVTGAPQLRSMKSSNLLAFRVTTVERYQDREGKMKESKGSHSVVIWGKRAEALNAQLHEGTLVHVEGSLHNRSYDDKNGGGKKWVTEVKAQNVFVLSDSTGAPQQPPAPQGYQQPPAPQGYQQPPAPQGYQQPPAPQGYQQPPAPQGYQQPPGHIPEDDLPF